jgi:hypothetical protein
MFHNMGRLLNFKRLHRSPIMIMNQKTSESQPIFILLRASTLNNCNPSPLLMWLLNIQSDKNLTLNYPIAYRAIKDLELFSFSAAWKISCHSMPFEHFITLYSTAIYLITLTFLVTPRVGSRTPDGCLAVPGSNPALSSLSPGDLPPGMALAEANLC